MRKNLPFIEWMVESRDDSWQYIAGWISHATNQLYTGKHAGDCTKQAHSCDICLLETFLEEYNQYIFHFDEWIKEREL